MSDELVEKVAHEMAKVYGVEFDVIHKNSADWWRLLARAAIAVIRPVVIEECAKAALHADLWSGDHLRHSDTRKTCADAIRALKEKTP